MHIRDLSRSMCMGCGTRVTFKAYYWQIDMNTTLVRLHKKSGRGGGGLTVYGY